MSKKKKKKGNFQLAPQPENAPRLLKIIKALVYSSLITPLVVHTGFIFPFVFPKILYFQIFVEIALVFWIFLMLKDERFRPKWNLLTKALVLFFVVMTVASIFGVNFYKSFFSNFERSDGLFTLAHFLAFLFIVSSCFRTRKDWNILLGVAVGISLMVSFYGLFQKVGWVQTFQGGESRLDSTTGNPAYLAAYLIFGLFFSLYLALKASSKVWKVIWWLAFVFQLVIIYFTATRGAILALFVGGLLFLVSFLFFWGGRQRIKAVIAVLLLLAMVFAFFVWLNKDASFVKNSPGLQRLTTISLKDPTTRTRLLAWRLSWRGFLDRPVLGWGWENYNVLFNKHFDPELFPTESWFDKAHNVFFDVAASGGILALAAYFLVFLACAYGLWRKGERDFVTVSVFSILLIVYFLQNLFVFDTPSTYLMVFLVLSFIASRYSPKPSSRPGLWRSLNTIFFKSLVVILVLVCFWYLSFRPASASRSTIKAAINLMEGKPREAIEFLQKAQKRKTMGQDEMVRIFADNAASLVGNPNLAPEIKESLRELTNQMVEEALLKNKRDARYCLTFSNIVTNLYLKDEPQKLNRAWEVMQEAIKLAPDHPLILYSLAQLKIFVGDFNGAIKIMQEAVSLNENVLQSHVTLSLAYVLGGQPDMAKSEIEKVRALNEGYIDIDDLKKMVRIWWQAKDREITIGFLDEMEDAAGASSDYWSFIIEFYVEIGEKERAAQAGQKLIEIDPSQEEWVRLKLSDLEEQTE